jgi:hypothetical protein
MSMDEHDVYEPPCPQTRAEYQREWRRKNPERVRASQTKWTAEHPERRREIVRLSMRRFRAKTAKPRPTLAERFWAKVEKGDGCWLWTGARTDKRYGTFKTDKTRYAHRVSYELAYGEIPNGLQVCHRCDNPPCVNPSHLFVGTRSDNMQDAKQKGRYRNPVCEIQSAKTHCKHGHEFTPENTDLSKQGHRSCRTCRRGRERRYAAA